MGAIIGLGGASRPALSHYFSDWAVLSAVRIYEGTWQARLFGKLGQWAVTWNGEVHITAAGRIAIQEGRQKEAALIAHEFVHVLQQKRFGWHGFLARYLWASLWNIGKPVDQHPYEREAYALSRQVEKDIG